MLKPRSTALSAGFTLVELMMAIVILAIVMAIAVPSYREYIQNLQIRNAAESVLRGLQLARTEAVSRNAPVRFTLDAAGSGWDVCVLNAAGNACASQIQRREASDGSSPSITATPDATRTYDFNGLGRMTAPVLATRIDFDSSVLSAAKSRDLRVQIDAGGMVRMCDPNIDPSGQDPRRC